MVSKSLKVRMWFGLLVISNEISVWNEHFSVSSGHISISWMNESAKASITENSNGNAWARIVLTLRTNLILWKGANCSHLWIRVVQP